MPTTEAPTLSSTERIDDELDLLAGLLPLAGQRIIELGCGAAQLARSLLARHPDATVTGLEVDERQQAKNRAALPQPGLSFVSAGAQAIPFAAGHFDLALMLKSLHHVPAALMDQALAEVARVLRPGGHLYISEPVFAGALNEVTRIFHDEGVVRAQAQAAIDRALATGAWQQVVQRRFGMPVHFRDFADFERRQMHATFRDSTPDAEMIERTRRAFEPLCGPEGVDFLRPMHLRLLRRC